jgi:hypothetical protein
LSGIIKCGYRGFFHKTGKSSPQQDAFTTGDKPEVQWHTFIRIDVFGPSKNPNDVTMAYGGFRNNQEFVDFLKKRYSAVAKDGGEETRMMRNGVYELIRDRCDQITAKTCDSACRFHMDCEWYTPDSDVIACEKRLVRFLITLYEVLTTCTSFRKKLKVAITCNSRMEETAYKNSFHITVQNVYLCTNQDKRVVDELARRLDAAGENDNGNHGEAVDRSIYSRNRLIRIPRCPKKADGPPMVAFYFTHITVPECITLVFNPSAAALSFEEEILAMLIVWPKTAITEDDYFVEHFRGTLFSPAQVQKGSRKRSSTKKLLDTDTVVAAAASVSAVGVHSDRDEEDEEYASALKKTTSALQTWLNTSAFSHEHGWNKPGTLDVHKAIDATTIIFNYTFSCDDKSFICASGVEHTGHSQKKLCLRVNANGDIVQKCFTSSRTGGKNCTAGTYVGNCRMYPVEPQRKLKKKEAAMSDEQWLDEAIAEYERVHLSESVDMKEEEGARSCV